jgi:predicted DNA-binding transcriptional regulator YafY
MFGIIIECERKNGYQYYISNPEVLKNNSTPTWMLQTLTVNNVLIDSLSIKDRLVLEEIPEGMEYLQTIIKAIKNNHVLSVGYQKFNDPKGYSTTIEPYCLKVFRQRWYLLGNNTTNKKELQIYALDRITHLEETSKTFELDPDFNASEFFKDYFGVFIGEEREPVRIVLRAYGKMIPLLRTLPKHHSQKEISTEKDYSDFEYLMAPTFDFKQEILKEGPDLEVLEPSSLRNDIIASLMETTHRYQQ